MKKTLFLILPLAVFMIACGGSHKWTDSQRDEVRSQVREHRTKTFLKQLHEGVYVPFEDCVVSTIEEIYPDYNEYADSPAQQDTLVSVMIECGSGIVGEKFENLSQLLPYQALQQAGVLPANMNTEMQKSFYSCLTPKVAEAFVSPQVLVNKIMMADSASIQLLDTLINQCKGQLGVE